MVKRMSRQEKKRLYELEMSGVAIDEVYGSRRASSLFLCLTKALIIFLVCAGTLTGFCGAFGLNYNKGLVLLFTALASTLISLLYVRKKIFYIGYVLLLVLFTVELLRYYLYANSGFQAIMNTVREAYGDHFNMSVVRNAEETYTNRYATITIALVFLAVFLVIMYNITISRYMNFAETFAISFIILEIPLYIGYKPPLISIILTMSGCIATGILQRGSFNRVTIPGKHAPDFIKDRFFKKEYYTTRGSYRGILLTIGFSIVFSLFICVLSLPTYERGLGKTSENSAKSAFDDSIKIFVQNGIYGFFNRYDSLNGLARGALGGVSSVRPDFETDLIVNFVPNSMETVYLRGFKGVEYAGQTWHSYVSLNRSGNIVSSQVIDDLDNAFEREILDGDITPAKMQINYVDMSFGMQVEPYITFPENISDGEKALLPDKNEKDRVRIRLIKELEYVPLNRAEYKERETLTEKRENQVGTDGKNRISYEDYVNEFCTQVPYSLEKYLDDFLAEHDNLGLDIRGYRRGKLGNDPEKVNEFRLKACAAIEELFLENYPYSLSPGKTPTDADFVRYFLESQKRGYCSHFASAAVMLLRNMGIPARYVEGYCIPSSLLTEEASTLAENGENWYSLESAFNSDKKVYSVEISDYYAHAWVEVYLEGKGFVPYEVTPPSYEAAPDAAMGGIGQFFSRLLNVDLGLGNTAEGSLSVTGDVTQAMTDPSDFDLNIIIVPLGIAIGAAVLFWIVFLLIRMAVREIRYSKYIKNGEYAKVVYGRYNEFVRRLKRRKVISAENPLPMELSDMLSEYTAEKYSEEKDYDGIFRYVEKVLYSDYKSTPEEYEEYYRFLKAYR